MSLELKPGWLERQARELTRPYTDEELAALNDDVGPFPSVHRMGATVAALKRRLNCTRCNRTGVIRKRFGISFDTDSAAEHELTYRDAPCPNCGDKEKANG